MKKIIQTDQAPAAMGTYSQAVQVNNVLYISGQIPLNAKTMQVVSGDFEQQTKQVFENLSAILKAANADFSNVVKLTIYLRDMDQFAIVNTVMATYFQKPYPARAVVEVSRLPKEAVIEMDAIAALT